MRKLLSSFTALILLGSTSLAQSVTPTITNAGGGSFNDPNSYFRYFDWSIGELTLVHTAAPADSSVVVYQGVLQPCTEKPGNSPVAGDFLAGDFKIMPNPTNGKFEINFFVRESGMMTLELVDMLGQVYEKRSFRYYCCRIEQYDISHLPAGVYLISATLIPDPYNNNFNQRQEPRHSGLRIIKTR